jgi:hypothetical protein
MLKMYSFLVLVLVLAGKPLSKISMRQLYEEYGLDANTQAFTGEITGTVVMEEERRAGRRREEKI